MGKKTDDVDGQTNNLLANPRNANANSTKSLSVRPPGL
jgi:hypothetical protein